MSDHSHHHSPTESALREPFVEGNVSLAQVTEDVCAPMERLPDFRWWFGFLLALSALALGVWAAYQTVTVGIGTWGLNRTIGWGFDITNFVFWVGIGHAGTLISAILFLFNQKWRTAINRSAEAMTIFAVMCAGLFPLLHMGRPWLFYWMLPYDNMRGALWVNFRSPLLWDIFAIGTYFTVSLVFWYIGLLPDLATVRDRAKNIWRKRIFGILSFGWNGSQRTWSRYETVYLLLAGLATPLVLSVHSVVSMDFATSVIPGWHTTIFPPYFVAGAIFSGFGMTLTLMLVVRYVLRLDHYITHRHIGAMCKIAMVTGLMVGLAYATEFFIAWYSESPFERFAFLNRALGPYAWAYWTMVACNVVTPQLFWFRRIRENLLVVFLLTFVINIGMWFERYVIVVTSLHRDFLPSSWSMYVPTFVEFALLIGSFGLFFTCFLLFTRLLPIIAIGEVKGVLKSGRKGAKLPVTQPKTSVAQPNTATASETKPVAPYVPQP